MIFRHCWTLIIPENWPWQNELVGVVLQSYWRAQRWGRLLFILFLIPWHLRFLRLEKDN